MKKVLMTLVFGMMTMFGFGQVIKVHVDIFQKFEHSSSTSTPQAAENNTIKYIVSGGVKGDYVFDLDKMMMSLECFDKNEKRYYGEFKIIEKFNTTNLVDVIVLDENNDRKLFVLGTTIVDGSYVLTTNKKEGDKIVGNFYPKCNVEIIKK